MQIQSYNRIILNRIIAFILNRIIAFILNRKRLLLQCGAPLYYLTDFYLQFNYLQFDYLAFIYL